MLTHKAWFPFAGVLFWCGVSRADVVVAPLEVRTFGGYYSGAGSPESVTEPDREYWAGPDDLPRTETQSREYVQRYATAQKTVAKYEKVRPLSADVLNPETGKIVWPKALLDNQYTAKRTELEELFELRANKNSCPESQIRIQSAARGLAAQLKDNIRNVSPSDYMKASRFLNSLAVSGN
jgi:hypothetical protein